MTQPRNQPPYPGQQQLPPPGFIRIHAKHKISTSWVPTTIANDGHLVAMNQGMQVVPVVPGPHVVTGHGSRSVDVEVRQG